LIAYVNQTKHAAKPKTTALGRHDSSKKLNWGFYTDKRAKKLFISRGNLYQFMDIMTLVQLASVFIIADALICFTWFAERKCETRVAPG
jgi:hypothetical protein